MKALLPTGDPGEPVRLAEVPEPIPHDDEALVQVEALRAAGPVIGRRVLLTGASGGVGHYATELAAAAGAQVTAVTTSPRSSG